jgi:hypothetical protein
MEHSQKSPKNTFSNTCTVVADFLLLRGEHWSNATNHRKKKYVRVKYYFEQV